MADTPREYRACEEPDGRLVTGFTPSHSVQEDTASRVAVSSCDCRPHLGVYCPEGETLVRLYDQAVRPSVCQYDDRLSLNIAIRTLSVHWGLDRPSTLLALLNKAWELARPPEC